MADIAIPVEDSPGELYIPSAGGSIVQTEVRHGAFFDTVEFTSGAITAGRSQVLFNTQTDKGKQDTNIEDVKKIPQRHKLTMTKLGLYVRQVNGNIVVVAGDHLKMYERATLEFKLGTRLLLEGPLFQYPTGYGVTGATTENNLSFAHLGVASPAAVPDLPKTQPVGDKDTLGVKVIFEASSWIANATDQPTLAGDVLVSAFLIGQIEKPMGV